MRYAGLIYAEHLTDTDLLRLADERGLAFGVLGSQALQAAQSWLAGQYELNLEALRDMGFHGDERLGEPPEFDDVLDAFTIPTLLKFDGRRQKGFRDNLVVAPSMQAVGLMGNGDGPGYIPRFDRKQGSGFKTTVLESVWDQIPDRAEAHDPHVPEGWSIAIVLDSGSDLDDSLMMSGDSNRGLLYRGMNGADQRDILATDEEDVNLGDTVELSSATLAQIILINAQRRIQGQPLLDDEHSYTRLPQYGDLMVNGVPQMPSVGTNGGQLNLGASNPREGFPTGGIREAIFAVPEPAAEPEADADAAAEQA
jgi:hypothetical protein